MQHLYDISTIFRFFADWLQGCLDFSQVLNTSIAASWLILVILLLRMVLKKAPKWTHVSLWGLAALRLLLPFSLESSFSLIPSAETFPGELFLYEGAQRQQPAYLDVVTNPVYTESLSLELDRSVDRLDLRIMELTFVWLAGILLMFLYTAASYLRLRRKVRTAVRLRHNLFQSEYVNSPFVLGIFRPRIYLPFRIDPQYLNHVIAHEQAHIRRKDHWWKPLGFLLLTIHWFNPLMWLAYILLCRDIEQACDEKVIRELNCEQRADYSQALLSCSIRRPMVSACPLAFGETNVRKRVTAVLHYKKPAFWLILTAALACAVAAVCFLTDPLTQQESPDAEQLSSGTTYVPYQCIYMNPFSSYMAFGGDSGFVYVMGENYFSKIGRGNGNENRIPVSDWTWQDFPYTDREWAALYEPDMNEIPNISECYDEIQYLPLNDKTFLLRLDEALWLVELSNNPTVGTYIWSIYSLVPESLMGSAQWEYAPQLSSRSPALRFQFNMDHTRITAVCTESPLTDFDTEGHPSDLSMTFEEGHALYWSPVNQKGNTVPAATIHFTIHQEDGSSYNGTIYISGSLNRGRVLYNISLTGTGLQLTANEESEGCVISLMSPDE